MIHFTAAPNVRRPLPGQVIHIDVFASKPLVAPPTVRVDGARYAQFEWVIGPRAYRFRYIPSVSDFGTVDVTGTATDGEGGQAILPHLFSVKYAGDADLPFGQFPFGYGNFAVAVMETPSNQEPVSDPYKFALRRGYEGPQIVASWLNPQTAQVRLVRRELDYPTSVLDGEVMYAGTGTSYADLTVTDGVVYYYAFFVESAPTSGVFLPFGRGHLLAIDNQPFVDWQRQADVLSRTVSAQPGAPATGDRYLLPATPTGAAWTGNGGKLAEWGGSAWSFTTPLALWTIFVQDEGVLLTYRLGRWVEVVDKQRFDLYALLEDYDRRMDQKSAFATLPPTADAALDGETFNFDDDAYKAEPTLLRFLKLFSLPMNEVRGLIEYITEFYDLRDVDIDLVLKAGALVGFDDYPTFTNPLRRFLVEGINSWYPRVGSAEAVELAIPMWTGFGPNATFRLKRWVHNLFVANESVCPVIAPTPDATYGTFEDALDRVMTFTWASIAHSRALSIWLSRPFDPSTFVPQPDVVQMFVATPPGAPAVGESYVVGASATGVWAGHTNEIARWDGLVWVFEVPSDRWSVTDGNGKTFVWKASSAGWWDAIPVESLLRLEWWLRQYAIPGTVYFSFFEDDVPYTMPVPPPVATGMDDDFESPTWLGGPPPPVASGMGDDFESGDWA